MRSRSLILPAVLVLAAVAPGVVVAGGDTTTETRCAYPVTATDATGTEVTVVAEADRVVTLAPSAAQTMWEIGGKDKVVGVSKYASYLDGAAAKTNISGSGRSFVVAEKVVALQPDIVLAPNIITNQTVAQLRDAGLTVFRFEAAESIEDVMNKTELIGRLTGECEGAAETVSWMKSELETVRAATEGKDRPRVLYTFFGYTAGTETFIHEIITTAGGENVAATADISGYRRLSQEVVVQQDPEWIVLNSGSPTVPKTEAYNGTYAVQHDQIVVVNEQYVSQPAPRIMLTVRKLARTFHPKAYAEANTTPTPTETPTPTTTTEEPVSDTPTDSQQPQTTAAEGQPGFTLLVGLVALTLLVLTAKRR